MRSMSVGIGVWRRRIIGVVLVACALAARADRVDTQSGLVAAWSFNEGTGTEADDRSSNSHVATLQGAGWSPGKYGSGVAFDGIDDYVSVADAEALDLTSALTVLAWVYPDVSNDPRTLLRKEASGGLAYSLSLTSDSKVRLQINIGGTVSSVTGSTVVLDEEWTHVGGTYDGSQIKVWVNGSVDGTASLSGSVVTTDQPLHIGSDAVSQQWFGGKIDEVRLYSAALNATQIEEDMEASIDDLTPPTITDRYPANSSINVHPGANITATFSESLDPATVTSSTFEVRDGTTALVGASVSYNDSTKTATLDPYTSLAELSTFTVSVIGGATGTVVKDVAGNRLAATSSWSFSTADVTGPTVTGTSPSTNGRNASLAGTIQATFNEGINSSTLTTSTVLVKDSRNVSVSGSVSYNSGTHTVTFTPSAALLPTHKYTVSLVGGSSGTMIQDLVGNPLATTYSWTFVTTVEPSRIAAGANHSVAVDDGGQVWTWGSNSHGQRGTSLDARLPGSVSGASSVSAVAAGQYHTLALKTDGTLLAWGNNSNGQLGNGNTTSQSTPVAVSSLTSVIAIAAGNTHSVALKSDGTVWAWGAGAQVGDGANTQRTTAVQVSSLSDVVAIAAGASHSLALKGDGTVWGWGVNTSGQIGDGTQTSPRLTPVQTSSISGVVAIAGGDYHSAAIVGSDLSLRAWGENSAGQLGDGTGTLRTSPVSVSSLTNARTVDAGANRTVAAMLDASVKIWGASVSATGSTSTVPIAAPGNPAGAQVAAGASHQLSVASNGVVWAWTENSSNQLGDGTGTLRRDAVSISESAYAWKAGTPMFNYPTGTYTSVLTVGVTTASTSATIRYTTDGSDPVESSTEVTGGTVTIDGTKTLKAKTWKSGQPASNIESATYTMQMPAPTFSPTPGTYNATVSVTISSSVSGSTIRYTLDGSEPTASSATYSAALSVDATTTIKARNFRSGWTDSSVATGTYTMQLPVVSFSPNGGAYSSAQSVTMSNSVSGATIRYTLDGSEPTSSSTAYSAPVAVSSSTTVRAIAFKTGWTASATKVANYQIAYGAAAAPTLDPAPGTYTGETIVRISATGTGAVIRYTTDGTEPTSRSTRYQWPLLIDATTTVKAKAFRPDYSVSSTTSGTYALDASGAVATPTISPAGGEFTTAQTVTISVATSGATIYYTTDGDDPTESDATVTSGGTITVSQSLPLKVKAFKSGSTASAIRRADYLITGAVAGGGRSSYAIKSDGTLWAWGYNVYGQLGDSSTTNRTAPVQVSTLTNVVAVAAGTYHALAVKSDGTVWSWGYNGYGQLGLSDWSNRSAPAQITALSNVVAVAAGDKHSIALKSDGTVWSWGSNYYGELGGGSTSARYTPTQVSGLSGISKISAGSEFSMALQDDGVEAGIVWAFGRNDSGQIGDGTTTDRTTPVRVGNVSSVSAIGTGYRTSYAATSDGAAWAWGSNYYGQIGDGTGATNRLLPVQLANFGRVLSTGGGSINAGSVTAEGLTWTTGDNGSGQLGDGTTTSRYYVDKVASLTTVLRAGFGEVHGLAVVAAGTVWAWGTNTYGAIGDGTTTLRTSPVQSSSLALVDNSWLATDPDGDGVVTWLELRRGSDPLRADSNGDGLSDGVSDNLGVKAGNPDLDGDGVSNAREMALGTDPYKADTDGDGTPDGADVFPLDPTRSSAPSASPGDTTAPTITLNEPTNAVPVP